MSESTEFRFKRIMGGADRSPTAAVLRAMASGGALFYATAMRLRNGFYDMGILPSRRMGRPTISVGNITTGGVGKTPVVQWLAKRLSELEQHPVVFMRGYKSNSQGISDEQAILESADIPVIAEGNRVRGAAGALERYPEASVFILDDGMQHRRAWRDFELTLIHAAEPFGFNRVFPRGLLREPIGGLKRANAVLITHADEVDAAAIAAITSVIRRNNATAPIFHCDHVIECDLSGKRFVAICGIGSPASFFWRLGMLGGNCVGTLVFDDHHDYTERDVSRVNGLAKAAGADLLITTTKDWVKLQQFAERFSLPVTEAKLSLRFWKDGEVQLLGAIRQRMGI
jgi:tetraacyldisaccharide 4'-kinase